MTERGAKVFSLAEANEMVPVVADYTGEVVAELEEIRQRHQLRPEAEGSGMAATVLSEVERLLQQWSERVLELGASPKGYFTVDFQSGDPELLYCWTYGEDKISYAHKVWENFTHRRPLSESVDLANASLKWVN
jgi:hypothetical protein